MSYHKLPTKLKQFTITTATLIVYGVVFFNLKTEFSSIEKETKLWLTQYGLFVIFASALLGTVGVFWSSKVRDNKSLAEDEIYTAQLNLTVLESQQRDLAINLEVAIKENRLILKNAEENMVIVKAYPSFVDFSGRFSILVLGIGTLMCVVGAG